MQGQEGYDVRVVLHACACARARYSLLMRTQGMDGAGNMEAATLEVSGVAILAYAIGPSSRA